MDIKLQCYNVAKEVIEKSKLNKGAILVVGCSTSEVEGSKIGTNSNYDTATQIFEGLYCRARDRVSQAARKRCIRSPRKR